MKKREKNKDCKEYNVSFNASKQKCSSCTGAFYGLGFIGALVYYLVNATGFWSGVLGVLKALVWPAFLVYELFKSLAM
ncbi:MAG: hypothetical protein ACP5OG_04345 [Candidatus Nanoarchaeia archaeon]